MLKKLSPIAKESFSHIFGALTHLFAALIFLLSVLSVRFLKTSTAAHIANSTTPTDTPTAMPTVEEACCDVDDDTGDTVITGTPNLEGKA